MPLPTIEVEVFGEPVIRRRLLRFADRATNARAAFHRIARVLGRAAAKQFSTSGSYGGVRWAELKPATVAYKLRANLDPRILRATHRLYDSLVVDTHAEHVQVIGRDEMRWGSRVPYGKFHQSTAPRSKLPWRPVVRLPVPDRRGIVKILQASLLEEHDE